MPTTTTSDEHEPLLQQSPDHESQEHLVKPDNDDEDAPTTWTRGERIRYSLVALVGSAGVLIVFIAGRDAKVDWKAICKKALGGGITGALAMVLQVLLLMPIRTIMNYQYRYGTSTTHATKTLYNDGGFTRYYRGMGAALFQAPLARFGDTFSNVGTLAFFDSNPTLRSIRGIQTAVAAIVAALFRMVITPIDTLKTTLQTEGRPGVSLLANRIRKHGVGSLWYGAFASAVATAVGFYPWFETYNILGKLLLPEHIPELTLEILLKQAFIGFVSSVVSDTISNSLRVIKTYRQVNATKISYSDAVRAVIAADGLKGLFGRGLKTRILGNGLQGLLFAVLWKILLDAWEKRT